MDGLDIFRENLGYNLKKGNSLFWSLVLFFGLFGSVNAKRYYNENAKPDTLMSLVKNPGAEDGSYWDMHSEATTKVSDYDTAQAYSGKASFMLDTGEKPRWAEVDELYFATLTQWIGKHQPNEPRKIDEMNSLSLRIRPDRSAMDSLTKGEGYFEFKIVGSCNGSLYSLSYCAMPASDTGFVEDTENEKYIRLSNLRNGKWNFFERNIKKDWESKGLPDCLIDQISLIEKGVLKRERIPGDTAMRKKWYGSKVNIDDISLMSPKHFDAALLWIEITDTIYGSFEPKACITNFGKEPKPEGLIAFCCDIYNQNNDWVYHNPYMLDSLKQMEEREISFTSFSPIEEGPYRLKIYLFFEDDDPTNDSMEVSLYYKIGIKENKKYEKPYLNTQGSQIIYFLPSKERIDIDIYDMSGRLIERINRVEEFGEHKIDLGRQNLSSGVYFVEFRVKRFRDVKKIVIIH